MNVGTPQDRAWAGIGRTSIEKRPVQGPVTVGPLGLAGDEVSDAPRHGGVDKAVYVFAREDLDRWEIDLGREIRDGFFGENLTTHGIDVNEAVVGERWRIGHAILQVADVRIPCATFAAWLGQNGYPNDQWVSRFTAAHRPGPYLRVIREGSISAGDPIEVIWRPAHGVTVSTMFRALTTDPDLLPALRAIEDLPPSRRAKLDRRLGAI